MPDGHAKLLARHELINLPNALTFARLCAVPVAVWLALRHHMALTFGLFVAAGITDAIDGWLARRLGPTRWGAMMDPVADKALLVCMYITLAAIGWLPDWIAILVVFRDLVIVGGIVALWMAGHPVAIKPLWISKLNTTLQIALVAAVLGLGAIGVSAPDAVALFVWAVALTTFASGAAYVWNTAHGR